MKGKGTELGVAWSQALLGRLTPQRGPAGDARGALLPTLAPFKVTAPPGGDFLKNRLAFKEEITFLPCSAPLPLADTCVLADTGVLGNP